MITEAKSWFISWFVDAGYSSILLTSLVCWRDGPCQHSLRIPCYTTNNFNEAQVKLFHKDNEWGQQNLRKSQESSASVIGQNKKKTITFATRFKHLLQAIWIFHKLYFNATADTIRELELNLPLDFKNQKKSSKPFERKCFKFLVLASL